MSNIYDVIEALRRWKGYSMRELAEKAGIPHTSLASIMARQSPKISIKTLDAIAHVFGKRAQDLFSVQSVISRTPNSVVRVSTELAEDDVRSILGSIIGENFEEYLPKGFYFEFHFPVDTETVPVKKDVVSADTSRHFRQSIILMLNKLNEEGVLEAMRRVLEVAQDPRYCISTDPHILKEDD